MPARNRVTPLGDIEAIPLRCAWTGNRGILHEGHEIVRLHASDLWITCALEFRGRWQEQWQPHHYTFLFFYDEGAVGQIGPGQPVQTPPMGPADDTLAVQLLVHHLRRRHVDPEALGPG